MGVFRSAICEDDPALRTQLCGLCEEIFKEWGIQYTISDFSSAEAAAQVLTRDPEAFDLLLLDIQMEGMSGLELARQLYDQGSPAGIIFITSHVDYALEGYQVHPIHFLVKPVSKTELDQAMKLAWNARCPRSVLLRQGRRAVSLPVAYIRYLESRNHCVYIHLPGEVRSFALSMADVEQMLPPGMFFRCHKSFLINLSWVSEVGRTELKLRDDTHLAVSRTFYAPFQRALIHYFNRNAGR